MDQYFVCQTCNTRKHIQHLKKCDTLPGDYCTNCHLEKCAACGELYNPAQLTFKPDIQNYICPHCLFTYHEVTAYIKPLHTTLLKKAA